MKKKLFTLITLLMLSIAAFAYTRTTSPITASSSCCCCTGDSCPMKDKDKSSDKASCCDNCKGDSCPMHKGDKDQSGEKASCCDNCKGDSCPMHKGNDAHNGAGHSGEHATGCSCACCKDKKKDGGA